MRQNKTNKKINKRCFSANGFSLLPLALRPRLFCLSNLFSLSSSPRLSHPLYLLVIILSVFTYFTINTLLGGSSSVSATSNLSLNLSINNNTNLISLDIASLGTNGTFRTSDTSGSNITVSTNNYTGYTLGILAKAVNVGDTTHSNALFFTTTDPNNNNSPITYTIPSITSSVSQSNYSNDNYAETNHLNNTWGYRPSTLYDAVNDTNIVNTDYLPAPTSTETANQTIIAKTACANGTANTSCTNNTDNYNIAIGARIDSSTPPGTYTNTFVITAVANSISYTVNYDDNTTDTVTDMPASSEQATVNTDDFTITLSSSNPKRSGYIFKGWCTSEVADNANCPHNTYRPDSNFPVDYTTNTTTLYARWIDATLWNVVVDEWELGGSRIQTNDTNVNTGIKAAITTSNSGVFQYNSTAFNGDTDATKPDGTKYDIYYFRGILDSNLDGTENTYGSNGDGVTWPNYVKLGDTCWRIVRTTASGGVKMIYNGKYSTGTTANSCANATTNAQLTTKSFNNNSQSIIAVGYTFNSVYKTTTDDTPYGTLFGTNSNYSGNTTDSTIKDYIENTWFNSTSGISAYESILEPNAGYCNDRSINGISNDNDIIGPYSGAKDYLFMAYSRNMNINKTPSLRCPRDEADVYTISAADKNNNVDTYGGNGQLKYPVALLTADEARFAGSATPYHYNSYLRSGYNFWLLSPRYRNSNGNVYGNYVDAVGYINNNGISYHFGVRPTISLIHLAVVSSGTGTAVDPFIISPPPSE